MDDYQLSVELFPDRHRLEGTAKVRFTAEDTLAIAVFGLHNGLRIKEVTDENGKKLDSERVSRDSTVRVPLPDGLPAGQSMTLTFQYEGILQSAADSPVPGLKLAYVGDDISYLLYAGRWFPTVGYRTDRFTSTIKVTVPADLKVIGSGTAKVEPAKATAGSPPRQTWTFVWDKPSFPGTIIAGRFDQSSINRGVDYQVFFTSLKKQFAATYADTAARAYEFFSAIYGPGPVTTIKVVELPDDTVPSEWAPEIVALSSRAIEEKTNYRLLANTIAHQWWGGKVSPQSRADFWLMDGTARYSEARYVEQVAGEAAFEQVADDFAVGALAYDDVPLSSVDRLDVFSPQFQSLVTDKGAEILHMLRWVVGDQQFDQIMRTFLSQFSGKSVSRADFEDVASQVHGENLAYFFTQWLDSTGAPKFQNKYTVYRTPKGFRVVGEITQDLDLFRMPVELKVETDGKTEDKRIEVVGTKSPYVVETFGKPRRILVDPNNRVLTTTPEREVRVAILRGQALVVQGNLAEALREFQKALEVNRNSSLAHYRIAEVFFLQRNYQAAANEYREAIGGDREPAWTEVWSHIQLGKIYDLTGQRERAVNEYRKALLTNDNTQGAQGEAQKYLAQPYEQERRRSSD